MQNEINTSNTAPSTVSKKHVYDYEVLVEADTAPAKVIRLVGMNKSVLEVGSGPGSITKILSSKNNCDVTALEVDPAAIEIVKHHCNAVVSADLNDKLWPSNFNGKKFDCVIAADVLEHVYKPLEVLIGMKSLLNENGEIVVSLPHIGHAGITARLLSSDFTYNDWGLLDRTHIRFFGLKNIDELFHSAGLTITEVQFVVRHPLETEFAATWTALSSNAKKVLLSHKSSYIYQAVVKATLTSRGNKAITVASTQVRVPKLDKIAALKQLLPTRLKQVLKRLLAK